MEGAKPAATRHNIVTVILSPFISFSLVLIRFLTQAYIYRADLVLARSDNFVSDFPARGFTLFQLTLCHFCLLLSLSGIRPLVAKVNDRDA